MKAEIREVNLSMSTAEANMLLADIYKVMNALNANVANQPVEDLVMLNKTKEFLEKVGKSETIIEGGTRYRLQPLS